MAHQKLSGIEREAGQATFKAEELARRLKLTGEVPCAGSDLQGQCKLLGDAREAQAMIPSAQGTIQRLGREKATVLKEVHALRGQHEALAGAPQALAWAEYRAEVEKVRINTSSCQVYFGIRKGESIPHVGDLLFTSDAPKFSSDELVDLHTRSRTFSVYYPDTRPGSDRYTVVASLNARYEDWQAMSDVEYAQHKQRLIDESLASLERHIPGIREKIDWMEAATPRTIERYTTHMGGTSFGTKFEGLKVSMDLPTQIPGLYHAGSVGIIMSGWLGTINYGVITANQIDKLLFQQKRGVSIVEAAGATHQGA